MVDQHKVEEAVRMLLEGIGEDPSREGLLETPARVARMYAEQLVAGMDEDGSEHLSKTFAVGSDDLVIERDITFYSLCEHHMLPFYGTTARSATSPTGAWRGSPSSPAPSRPSLAVCSSRSS